MTVEWKTSEGFVQYEDALMQMEARVAEIISGDKNELVWLVEHPPLYTAGTSAKQADLLEPDKFPVYNAGRGGEFTYHGPGQRVVYVMLNLRKRNAEDIRAFVYNLEQWIINTLDKFSIDAGRREGRIGIWVDNAGREAKIGAIGIRVRRWVTFHGIAINLAPDLNNFQGIVPCGISEYGVTSFADLGKTTTMPELDAILKEEYFKTF